MSVATVATHTWMSPRFSECLVAAGSMYPKMSCHFFNVRRCLLFAKEALRRCRIVAILLYGSPQGQEILFWARKIFGPSFLNRRFLFFVPESTNSPPSRRIVAVLTSRQGTPGIQSTSFSTSLIGASLPRTFTSNCISPIASACSCPSSRTYIFDWPYACS